MTQTQAAPFIGIDFGTSKSSMAWYDNRIDRADMLYNAEGERITPSVVYLGPSEDQILVGEAAERKLKQVNAEQRRFVLSVKRDLIRGWTKVLDNKVYSPVKVASLILAKLREDAETHHFHQPVQRAVITHPASFDAQQQDKIKEAATLAGFSEVELLSEPVAAALTYASTGLRVGNYVMVYDFGGGTFDVAVLERVSGSKFRRAATRGRADCGGDDLDKSVYAYCEEIVRREMQRQSISLNEEYDLRFLRLCRECKENLTTQPDYTFSYLFPSSNGRPFEHMLTRPTFEGGIKAYIDRTVALTQEVLQEAQSKNYKVETIVLVGGSSRVPLVHRSLSSAMSVESEAWQYQDVAVAMGAAYHAQQLWGTKSSSLHNGAAGLTGPLGGDQAPPLPPPPPPPPPTEEYRRAVKNAWATKTLTPAKVNALKTEASRLHLSGDQAAAIEREVMGNTKENIVAAKLHDDAKADYRKMVKNIQANQLTQPLVDTLAAKARTSGLNVHEAAAIEREFWYATKEEKLSSLQPVVPPPPPPPPVDPPPVSKPKKVWKFTVSKFLALCLIAIAVIGISQSTSSSTSSSSSGQTVGVILIVVGLIWFFHKNRVA